MMGVQYSSMKEVTDEEIQEAIDVLNQAKNHFDKNGDYENGTKMCHAFVTLEVEFLEE